MFNVFLGNSHNPTVSVHVSKASLQSLFGKPEAVPIATILHTHTHTQREQNQKRVHLLFWRKPRSRLQELGTRVHVRGKGKLGDKKKKKKINNKTNKQKTQSETKLTASVLGKKIK